MEVQVVLSQFMFDEPSAWVTMATVVTLLSTIYLGFAEIIGSHLQYSKFTNYSKQPSSGKRDDDDGMMKVSSRRGMLILYTPAFVAGFVSFFVFPGGGLRFLLLKLALTFHFFKRDYEVLFVHKYSGNMGLGSTILISIFYFYVATSMIIVHYMSLGLPEPPINLMYIGLVMFIAGIIGNFYHHNLLAKLRTNKENEYKIPHGGLFNLVICPHYMFEILMFFGFAFISQTSFAFACALGDSCYLIARSHQTRNWYVKKFEDFPASIKCLIPYIF